MTGGNPWQDKVTDRLTEARDQAVVPSNGSSIDASSTVSLLDCFQRWFSLVAPLHGSRSWNWHACKNQENDGYGGSGGWGGEEQRETKNWMNGERKRKRKHGRLERTEKSILTSAWTFRKREHFAIIVRNFDSNSATISLNDETR